MQPITKQTQTELFEQLDTTFEMGEVGAVFCPPISGRDYRIDTYIEARGKSVTKLNLLAEKITDPEDIDAFLSTYDGAKPGLIVSPAEQLLNLDLQPILFHLLETNRTQHRGMLFFFDCFPSQLQDLPASYLHDLSQQVVFHPLFSLADTSQFLTMLAARWNFSVSRADIQSIYTYTGGHTWLLKEVARQRAKGVMDLEIVFSSQQFVYRASTLWTKIPAEHQLVLKNVLSNVEVQSNGIAFHELSTMGFISDHLQLGVPGFVRDVIQALPQANLTYRNGCILINEVNVSPLFSKGERRLLRCLLDQKDSVRSREILGKAYWQDAADYSDWALDQAIRRLRSKLQKLGVGRGILQTIKNQGYVLRV